MGAQSAGKSSVLAALVGADFLPRGTGVVTRCPLVLQLVRAPPGTPPTAEFHHAPGKKFVDDFAGVAAEVAAETERRAGGACGIVADPIRLRIASPSVLTMTLVDLPGLARVPMGDQPADVEARVRELCLAYIRAPSCVVLAVTPAGADPATSDGLALARAVDPAGDRTLGVLTKVDLMDGGTSAAPLLRADAPPRLRLGYIAVACRGAAAAAAGATPADERSAEAAFFACKPEYAGLGGVCGVPALARALNRVLADAVRGALPTLASALDDAVAARAAEVARLGAAPPGASAAARGALLLGLLESYARNFSGAIAGTSPTLPLTELAGGARLRHVFQDVFVPAVSGLDPAAELGDGEVRTALKNAGGARGTLLIPDAPFELLTRRAVASLLPPCLACVSLAHAEVLRIAEDALPAGVDRFPSLRRELLASVEGLVAAGAAPAERMVRDLVACELAFINTDHPDFVGGARAVAAAMEARSAVATAAAASPPRRAAAAPPSASPTKGGLAAALDPPPLRCPSELLGGGDASPSRAAAVPPPARAWLPGWARGGGGDAAGASHPAPPATTTAPGAAAGGAPTTTAPPPLAPPPRTLTVPPTASGAEAVQVDVTRTLVSAYHAIVARTLADAVPKAVMHFMVGATAAGLQAHLIRDLYREERFGELTAERADVAARRAAAAAGLEAARRARAVVERVPAALAAATRGGGGGRVRRVPSAR